MTWAGAEFDPYHKWLGIRKRGQPSFYELLALSLDEDDEDVIRAAVEQRRTFIQSKRGEGHDAAVGEILSQIGEAEVTLLDPQMRRDYDRRLGLFEKRKRKRRVDPNAPRSSRFKSRPGRTVGEESGLTRELAGVMSVIVAGFLIILAATFFFWNRNNKPAAGAAGGGPNAQQVAGPAGGAAPAGGPPAAEGVAANDALDPPDADPAEPQAVPGDAAVAQAAGPGAVEADDFVELLAGPDLAGWTALRQPGNNPGPAADWTLRDGVLECATRKAGWLRYDRELGDFTLELEFLVPRDANSGVLIRHAGEEPLPQHGMEVQIIDAPPGKFAADAMTGAIFNAAPASPADGLKRGEWNRMSITCQGEQVAVTLNGVKVVDAAMDKVPALAGRPRSGFIGFYNHDGSAQRTKFRNIRLRVLSPAAAFPSAVASDSPEAGVLPRPVLYLPGDDSLPGIPSNPSFKRKAGRYVPGRVGQAVRFDGQSYAEMQIALPAGNAPRTLAVWLKDERGPVNHLVHPVTYGPVISRKPFGIMQASGKWRFFDYSGGLDSGIAVDKQWHHHAVTFDGRTIRYIIDGRSAASLERKLETGPGLLGLGGYGENAKNFVGLLDELYVFDVPLSDVQIRSLMAGTAKLQTAQATTD